MGACGDMEEVNEYTQFSAFDEPESTPLCSAG